ncbi:MAG: F0F1 ATP synthase subunit B [Clostridia bacterium]|nr:F0F1 ATP synthase subunit B [Clostridia bacterium]
MGYEEFLGVNPWTALFVLLNTLIIFFVARKFLFKPVQKIIHDRQAEIDDMYSKADQARENAEAMEADYKQKLGEAQAVSERMVREAEKRGQMREESILSKANAEAAAILDKAGKDAALEKKKAMNEAKNEISAMAVSIAEKVVDGHLKPEGQAALVDKFIDDLGDTL